MPGLEISVAVFLLKALGLELLGHGIAVSLEEAGRIGKLCKSMPGVLETQVGLFGVFSMVGLEALKESHRPVVLRRNGVAEERLVKLVKATEIPTAGFHGKTQLRKEGRGRSGHAAQTPQSQ